MDEDMSSQLGSESLQETLYRAPFSRQSHQLDPSLTKASGRASEVPLRDTAGANTIQDTATELPAVGQGSDEGG